MKFTTKQKREQCSRDRRRDLATQVKKSPPERGEIRDAGGCSNKQWNKLEGCNGEKNGGLFA